MAHRHWPHTQNECIYYRAVWLLMCRYKPDMTQTIRTAKFHPSNMQYKSPPLYVCTHACISKHAPQTNFCMCLKAYTQAMYVHVNMYTCRGSHIYKLALQKCNISVCARTHAYTHKNAHAYIHMYIYTSTLQECNISTKQTKICLQTHIHVYMRMCVYVYAYA
jgi:hypothetical protein